MTDAQLLEKFKQMHPTYTARTLQKVLCIGARMSYLILQTEKLEEYQRRMLFMYMDLPEFYRLLYFPL